MCRDPVWIAFLLACLATVIACAAPGILGGPTEDTTTVLCPDGSRCPIAFPSCPPVGSRAYGGRCEYEGPEIETGARHAVDAGH